MLKHAIYSSIPKRRHHRARLSDYDQYEIAQKIWAFKSGRNYAKRWAANMVCDTLSLMDMTDTIFLCIPASCQHTHARRFK